MSTENFNVLALLFIGFVIWLKLRIRRKQQTRHTHIATPGNVNHPPELIPGLLTLHQAYEGVLVMGGTGSGKTTGPGEQMARALLALGDEDHETGISRADGEARRNGPLGSPL